MGYRKVGVLESASKLKMPWTQLRLGSVEDHDVKIAVYSGEYNLHVHEHHDEFIYVLSGEVVIEFDNEEILLRPGEGLFIEHGTPHSSRSQGRAEVLLFEGETIMDDYVRLETGNAGH